ncbi:MAG: hypothetical protein PHS04_00100 [Tissierellia bacterium]|nr:hypothetical protein [Tissierellia bacterium]
MKFTIGKYPFYFNIYKILKKLRISDDLTDRISNRFFNSRLGKFLNYYDNDSGRKVSMKLSKYDYHDPSDTISIFLSYYINKIKDRGESFIVVDDSDIPKEMYDKYKNHPDYFTMKSEWLFDEIIGTFSNCCISLRDNQKIIVWDDEIMKLESRIENGLRLFTKYFRDIGF